MVDRRFAQASLRIIVSLQLIANQRGLERQLEGALVVAGGFSLLRRLVVGGDRVLMQHVQGRRAVDSTRPVDSDTRFRIASLSKGFASTLTALLVDEGRLSWSQGIAEEVDGFRLKSEPDTRGTRLDHVLSHRIGLPPNAYDNLLEAGRPLDVILPRYADVDLICPVGTCYAYQNIGYNLVVDVIEGRTGVDYEGQVRSRLFEPLGMDHADFGLAGLVASENWAPPHVGRGTRLRRTTVNENYYRLPAAAGRGSGACGVARCRPAPDPRGLPAARRRQGGAVALLPRPVRL